MEDIQKCPRMQVIQFRNVTISEIVNVDDANKTPNVTAPLDIQLKNAHNQNKEKLSTFLNKKEKRKKYPSNKSNHKASYAAKIHLTPLQNLQQPYEYPGGRDSSNACSRQQNSSRVPYTTKPTDGQIGITQQTDRQALHQLLIEWTKRSLWNSRGNRFSKKIFQQAEHYREIFNVPKYQIYSYFWNELIEYEQNVRNELFQEKYYNYTPQYMVDDKTILKMCKNRLKPSIYDKFLAILENLTSCQLTSNDDLAASKSSCCGEQTTSRAIKKTINLANRPVTIQSYPCKDNEIVIRVYDCNNTNTNIEDALYQFDLNYNPNTDIIIIDEPLEFVEVPRETLKKNSDFVQDLKASKRRKLEGEIPKYKIKCVSRDPANLQNSHKKPVTPNKDSSNVDKNYLKRPKPQESVKQNLCVAEVTSLTNNKNAYQNLLEMAMVKDKPLNKPKSNKKITLKTTSKANVRSPMPGKSVSGKLSGKKAHQTNINKLGHNQQTSTAVSNADDDVVICLYSCEICFKAFETFNEMQEHFNKSLCASKLRIFQCNNCSNNIFGFYNFMKHLMECENIDPYKSQL